MPDVVDWGESAKARKRFPGVRHGGRARFVA